MSKEYEHWRKEAISCTLALDEQRKITEELIHPLQDQLAELEERIKEQMGKVTSIRS
jgi:polyhydroxyalkanoate synthesis regulator phasin